VIPRSVTVIESDAFSWCSSLSEVIFARPSSLTAIEPRAFFCCLNLTSIHIVGSVSDIAATFIQFSGVCEITIDDDHGRFGTIDHFLVEQGGRSLVCTFASESELVVPSDVVSLKAECFSQFVGLEAVSFESGSRVEVVEKAFSDCSSLQSIRLPGSLVVIGEEAFVSLSALVEVSFEVQCVSINSDIMFHPDHLQWVSFRYQCHVSPRIISGTCVSFPMWALSTPRGTLNANLHEAVSKNRVVVPQNRAVDHRTRRDQLNDATSRQSPFAERMPMPQLNHYLVK
jgi:hypothetical protein